MATFPREVHTQQVHYIFKSVTYSDSGISAGTLEFPASLPAGAHIIQTNVDITTAFAATTTNVLTVGTVSGTATDIVSAGDIDETTAAMTIVKGVGTLSASGEKKIYVKFTGAGTANTAGAADICVLYVQSRNP